MDVSSRHCERLRIDNSTRTSLDPIRGRRVQTSIAISHHVLLTEVETDALVLPRLLVQLSMQLCLQLLHGTRRIASKGKHENEAGWPRHKRQKEKRRGAIKVARREGRSEAEEGSHERHNHDCINDAKAPLVLDN